MKLLAEGAAAHGAYVSGSKEKKMGRMVLRNTVKGRLRWDCVSIRNVAVYG